MGSLRDQNLFLLLFSLFEKTKTKRHLPWALTIDVAGKVIGNPKKSNSPPVREQFLFCYRHAIIPATSINDCDVADSFNVYSNEIQEEKRKHNKPLRVI